MACMNIKDRYDDISRISGLSEEIIRRVFKATKESLSNSLKHGERATIPGICTLTPEIKNKIELGGESMTTYIKIKASASSVLESEFSNVKGFETNNSDKLVDMKDGMNKLHYVDDNHELPSYRNNRSQIRTSQINALL